MKTLKSRYKKKKKRGPVRAKKVTFDGIKFASGLERYMYQALKKAKIHALYEGFPLRWKMFKKYVNHKMKHVTLYKPQNQKECDEVIKLIIKNQIK
jgi:hypothetical protein